MRIAPSEAAPLTGRASLVESRGPEAVVTVDVGQVKLNLIVPTLDRPREGEVVGVDIEPGSLVFFGGDSNRRIEAGKAGRTL